MMIRWGKIACKSIGFLFRYWEEPIEFRCLVFD
nr:MAG TPA: hypothetical protein [Caudoviricetes sp.]DAN82058.1 MAG TPA: hypothetical protein [Caudoviricetes sp.]DAY09908.1 MAG TPA: hypothetical protein [Caudoviricetes sp.]